MKTRHILKTTVIVLGLILAAMALLYGLYIVRTTILLVILAIFFAYGVAPLVDVIERFFRASKRRVPRPAAIALAYLVLFIALGGGLYFLLPYLGDQLGQLKDQAPGYIKGVQAKAQEYNNYYIQRLSPNVRETVKELSVAKIEEIAVTLTQSIPTLLLSLVHYLPWLFLVPILAFFMLKDAASFRVGILRMLPHGDLRWRGNELVQDVNNTVAAYIRAQLIACLFIGTICTLAFIVLGVPYSVLLGVLAGLFEFVPLIGPALIALMVSIITLVVTGSPQRMGLVLLFLLILRLIHDYVTYPRIIGQGIHLHPLAIILSVLAGAELAGIPGVFLAVPVVALTTVLYRHWLAHRGSTGLVADMLASPVAVATTATGQTVPLAPEDLSAKGMVQMTPDTLTGDLPDKK